MRRKRQAFGITFNKLKIPQPALLCLFAGASEQFGSCVNAYGTTTALGEGHRIKSRPAANIKHLVDRLYLYRRDQPVEPFLISHCLHPQISISLSCELITNS